MKIAAVIAVGIVAVIQIAIAVGEIFFWQSPLVYSRIDFPAEMVSEAYRIVKNAGLYNSFIAAGLIWGTFAKSNAFSIRVFFLVCVTIAGIFGAVTLKWTTLVLQTVPALVALILVWLLHRSKLSN